MGRLGAGAGLPVVPATGFLVVWWLLKGKIGLLGFYLDMFVSYVLLSTRTD